MRYVIVAILGLLPTISYSQDLVEFENGQVADADDMNANFSSLKEAIDSISIEAGATLLTGEGAPIGSTGAIGDVFIDTLSYAFYGPKTENGWGNGVSLVGPTGLTGADGPQGPQGETGARGPKGDTGDTGAVGPQGPKGDNGFDGEDGRDGADGTSCSATQETGGASISCTDGSNASLVNGINGTNGTNGTNGVDGIDGQDGRSCTSSQGDGVVTISCDDGTSGEVASGRCTATQSGSNIVIDCADGSGGILASEGTVVTFLDGQLGEIDYTFNTGDIVLYDANDVQLGKIDTDASSGNWALIVRDDPYLLLRISNGSEAINFPNHSGLSSRLYYNDADCAGAVFYDRDLGSENITTNKFSPTGTFYTSANERYDDKLVKSHADWGTCTTSTSILNEAYLLQAYEPAQEILNAAFPLYIDQVP